MMISGQVDNDAHDNSACGRVRGPFRQGPERRESLFSNREASCRVLAPHKLNRYARRRALFYEV